MFNTIRKKAAFTVAITTTGLSVVIGVLVLLILLNGVRQLEIQNVIRSINGLIENIENEVVTVNSIAGDWAPWDATYQYMHDQDPAYITENLNDASIANLELNVFALVDTKGNVIYQKDFDLQAGESKPVLPGLQNYLNQHPRLLIHPSVNAEWAGLVTIDDQTLILSSHPVVTSEFTGPIAGTLIIGRILNARTLNEINNIEGAAVDFQNSALIAPGSDFDSVYGKELKVGQILVKPIDSDHVEGYTLFDDIYGLPKYIFRVNMYRDIYQFGARGLAVFLALTALSGIIFGFVFMANLDRMVLSRIRVISRTVAQIKSSSDLSKRIHVWGKDELSYLARQINETFEMLHVYSKQLEENQAQLEYEAHHDTLTGFPNRSFFVSRLNESLRKAHQEKNGRCAVLFLDLDRFKLVNDSYNHEFGDRLLVELSHRLNRCVRGDDFVARFGGDEFVILLDHVTDESVAIEVADRIKRELSMPFFIRDKSIFISASIGITLVDGSDRPEDALRNADIAMYRAKAQGKARYAIFEDGTQSNPSSRLELENELRHALAHGEFEVYYQPIVSISDRKISSIEALVRWRHASRGLLAPREFLSTVEEIGLILPLSEFVTATALSHLQQLQNKGFKDLTLSLNYSYPVLREPYIVDWLTRQVEVLHLDARSVQIELTENAVMSDFNPTMNTLHRLKAAGFRLALDDFGTGYSSLLQIKSIPADCLKIDQAFMRNILEPGGDQAVVLAVIAMANNLKMDTVAEGVETREQLEFLARSGCHYAQGYYLAKPMAYSSLLAYLNKIEPARLAVQS